MPEVPQHAIDRLRRLRERADATRASFYDAQQRFLDARAEVGRLEAAMHAHGNGSKVQVDEDGTPFFYRDRRGHPVTVEGGVLTTVDQQKIPVTDPAAHAAAKRVVAARERADAAMRRRDRLGEQNSIRGQLVRDAERLLVSRGWREEPSFGFAGRQGPSALLSGGPGR